MSQEQLSTNSKKSIVTFAIVAIVLIIFQSAFVIVDAGHVGVIKRLGAVQMQPFKRVFILNYPLLMKSFN